MRIEQSLFSLPLEEVQDKNYQQLQGNARKIRTWMRSLSHGQLKEFSTQRSRALRLLQLDNRHHIGSWLNDFGSEEDPSFRSKVYSDANVALARNFGIPLSQIATTLERYAEGSNLSVTIPKDKMPKDVSGKFELVNEAELFTHPIDLLLLIFDPTYSLKARFEAIRKLGHMEADAEVEGDPILTKKRDDYIKFTQILNKYAWMKDQKTGQVSEVYFLSTHDPENDFECTLVEVREMTFAQADELSQQLPSNQQLVVASRRRFQVQSEPQKDRIVDIYISNRLKTSVDRRVKSERKNNGEDPHISNKDTIGARIVANTKEELELFIDHLRYVADQIKSDIKIWDYQDSINGGDFNGDNPGSSKDMQMIKFLLRVANIELEMQAYESIGFANASFKEGQAHAEYYWRRLFNSGWFERNFPESIYGYSSIALQNRLIRHERELIEGKPVPIQLTPPIKENSQSSNLTSDNVPVVPPTYLGKLLTRVVGNAGVVIEHARRYLQR